MQTQALGKLRKNVAKWKKDLLKFQPKVIVSSFVSLSPHCGLCTLSSPFLLCVGQDLLHGRIQMKTLTNKWYEEVRQGPSGSEDDEDEAELL